MKLKTKIGSSVAMATALFVAPLVIDSATAKMDHQFQTNIASLSANPGAIGYLAESGLALLTGTALANTAVGTPIKVTPSGGNTNIQIGNQNIIIALKYAIAINQLFAGSPHPGGGDEMPKETPEDAVADTQAEIIASSGFQTLRQYCTPPNPPSPEALNHFCSNRCTDNNINNASRGIYGILGKLRKKLVQLGVQDNTERMANLMSDASIHSDRVAANKERHCK